MTKKLESELDKLIKAKAKYDKALKAFEKEVVAVCAFPAYVSFFEGDGFLIGNENTSNVAMLSCLSDATRRNKLEEFDHLDYCI